MRMRIKTFDIGRDYSERQSLPLRVERAQRSESGHLVNVDRLTDALDPAGAECF